MLKSRSAATVGQANFRLLIQVISVCQHINTRVKPPSIKLPVATLLRQYKDNHSALVRHFDILYIQQGLDRLAISVCLLIPYHVL